MSPCPCLTVLRGSIFYSFVMGKLERLDISLNLSNTEDAGLQRKLFQTGHYKACNFIVTKGLQLLSQDFHINDTYRLGAVFPSLSYGLLKTHMCRSKKRLLLRESSQFYHLLFSLMTEDITGFFFF